jgi:hypothetical protein
MDEIKSYPDKLQVLNEILKKGIQELCQHAKQNNYLEYPYGRNPDPTPLITEEQFIAQGGLTCNDTEPNFHYEYGFDPLKFLSEYIVWAHPDSVKERLGRKLEAQARLQLRANHAVQQLKIQSYFKDLVHQLQSGIEWGPFINPVNFTTVRCVLKPFKAGIIYCQISTDPSFQESLKTYKAFHFPSLAVNSHPEGFYTLKDQGLVNISFSKSFDLPNLQEKNRYYIRCFSIPITSPKEEIPNFDPKLINQLIDVNVAEETKFAFDITLLKEFPINGQYNYNSFTTFPDPNYTILTSHKANLSNYSVHHNYQYEQNALAKFQFFGQLPVTFLQKRWERNIVGGEQALSATSVEATTEEIATTNNEEASPANASPTNTGVNNFPAYSCLLGDVFQHSFYDNEANFSLNNLNNESTHLYTDINEMVLFYYYQQMYYLLNNLSQYTTAPALRPASLSKFSLESILKAFQSSLFIAWRDSNPQSCQLLKWEETIYKQYRHDIKKYNKKYGIDDGKSKKKKDPSKDPKKESQAQQPQAHIPPPPVLKRPPVSPQLDALLQVRFFPFPEVYFLILIRFLLFSGISIN